MPYGITQSYLPPSTGSIYRPYPGRCFGRYSICPTIKDKRLSIPEPRQVNDLPTVATEVSLYRIAYIGLLRRNRQIERLRDGQTPHRYNNACSSRT